MSFATKIPLIISLPSLLILTINAHFVLSQCVEDHKSLLLQLRNSLNFDATLSTKLVHWSDSTDCCQWRGVKCDNSTGQVIELDLSEEAINGGLNNTSSLFRIQSLQSLNLAYNHISVELPTAFGKLSALTYLNLSSSGFIGQVPIQISYLVNLVILDMSFSYVNIENPNLATIIRNLTNIRELYLDNISLSAEGKQWCQTLSSSLPRLQVLSMSSCNLTGEICQSLANLHSLSVIHLHLNNFSAPIPEFLARFKNLTALNLGSSGLIGTVPQEIFQVPTLTTLDLSYNERLIGTLPNFQQNLSLQTLILKFTNFSGPLPDSISNLKMLLTLDLWNCSFHGIIPSSIASLNLLDYLDLSSNNMSGPFPSFSSLTNLRVLRLQENSLTGSINSTNWRGLQNLERVQLSDNSLIGSIPSSLFSLPSLQELSLARNFLSGQLNDFSSKPSMLSFIYLSSNQLEGPVPKSIFSYKDLEELDLSWNRFNGTLELNEILARPQKLRCLDLSYNHISLTTISTIVDVHFPQLNFLYLSSCNLRVVPEFLKNQSHLKKLDLSNNQIQGMVPNWIWKVGDGVGLYSLNLSCNKFYSLEQPFPYISSLDILDLHSNNLQGHLTIPSMPSYTGLKYLDCSNNRVTSINPNIGKSLKASIFFSLSRNNLHGSIPTSLCYATMLQVLDLGNNHLSGTIPNCLIAMARTLTVLNLGVLEGSIPNGFGKDCKLETLDLSRNSIQGQIPKSLDYCTNLKVLNLANNQLNDTFPCQLRSLSNLQVIMFRSNKFHGNVVCLESYSVWPLLQIIDLGSNQFTGELTSHLLLKWPSMMAKTSDKKSAVRFLHYAENMVNAYYQDKIEVILKGFNLELEKITTSFKSIDFSSNAFHGVLPKELGNLNALEHLNLSNNCFSGNIPSSIGNLSQLDSLDLSCNALNGKIPQQLTNLNFVGVMNLSFNKLEGEIPRSTQLQSFEASSYMGNQGLCGPPLASCQSGETPELVQSTPRDGSHWSFRAETEWVLRGVGVGFPAGVAAITVPLFCISSWRLWLDKMVFKILYKLESRRKKTKAKRGRKQTSSRR